MGGALQVQTPAITDVGIGNEGRAHVEKKNEGDGGGWLRTDGGVGIWFLFPQMLLSVPFIFLLKPGAS